MLESDTAFHLGPELDRAVNRMDFFRLFKALSAMHDSEHFILVEVPGDDQPLDLNRGHSLHNVSDALLDSESDSISPNDPLVFYLRSSTAPRSFDGLTTKVPLIARSNAQSAIVVPLHTAIGRRFALILFRNGKSARHQEVAIIAHDAAVVFQRYFEVILSLDSISGLSDREIQIVSWTSEGKTSSEIAIILGLSEHTVNSYIAAVLRKLHVVNRAQMVASALRNGLIS